MPLPPQLRQNRHEAIAVAIAAIGVGMFIGNSIIGPLVSRQIAEPAAASSEPLSFEAMVARPDPFPYRTPTPTFETSGVPHYAAAAKEKAQAEVNGQASAADDRSPWEEQSRSRRSHWRYRVPDRFAPQ